MRETLHENVYERAKNGLHDYLIWLRDRGDKSDEFRCYGHSKQRRERLAAQNIKTSTASAITKSATHKWVRKKEAEWSASGRIGIGGYLTVSENLVRWDLQRISTTWPQLNQWDKLAVLYIVDGTITEAELTNINANIREVFDEIVEMKVARMFSAMLQAEKHNSQGNDYLRPLNYRKTNKTATKNRRPEIEVLPEAA